MAKRKAKKRDIDDIAVGDYRHSGAKRKNIPPAKIASEGKVPEVPKIQYSYSPRRPPELRFDSTGTADRLPDLLEKATRGPLTAQEARVLADALRVEQPWLQWSGKAEAEAKGFTVDPVALHIHERISAQAILKVAARKDVERTLFSDPEQEYHEAVQFYKHDIDWTNRMILGDSLQVMASLAHREDLAGKAQMIYMDPPYGIKYGSNFQPEVGKRDVKDKDSDLTREPETVKAYRDVWHLGVHSYLTYLRDRLCLARQLLNTSGSIFVQINDENLQRVRILLDEVFGAENFVCTICFSKTGWQTSRTLASVLDYILWYAKSKPDLKYHQLYFEKVPGDKGATGYDMVEGPDRESWRQMMPDEKRDPRLVPADCRIMEGTPIISSGAPKDGNKVLDFNGKQYLPPGNSHWKVSWDGLQRACESGRIFAIGNRLEFRHYLTDFAYSPLTNVWLGLGERGFAGTKLYAVQTAAEAISRCVLMTTDPGDLVIDPTCGSGTTAFCAETWGRRWITIDTSRVAIAIARQRLLSSSFPFYRLKEPTGGIAAGLTYKTAPHVTLGAVARNTHLDSITSARRPALDAALSEANKALACVTDAERRALLKKLASFVAANGVKAFGESERRRFILPGNTPEDWNQAWDECQAAATERSSRGQIKRSSCPSLPTHAFDPEKTTWNHWEVPFDSDSHWPEHLRAAVNRYRIIKKEMLDEINDCIAANASQEDLVDQPEVVKGITRVSGPFTVEAVQPPEQSIGITDGLFDGAPGELEDTFDLKNVDSFLDEMTRLLRMDGVRFPRNRELKFTRLDRLAGQSGGLHAEGRWHAAGETDEDPEGKATVAVGFGPQYGPVTAKQVEDLIRSASRQGYDALVVAGFSFDGPAQAVIEESPHPKLKIHMAHIRPDINPGMSGLLKEQPGSQLFTVFGQPRTNLSKPDVNGEYTVTMEGVDIYDPVTNTTRATDATKIAAWFLDGDYDGRTFCITQAFFPDKSAWEKLAKALGGVVPGDAFDKLSGNVSLPFPKGKHKCCAVKVIDPRGNEVMQVHKLD